MRKYLIFISHDCNIMGVGPTRVFYLFKPDYAKLACAPFSVCNVRKAVSPGLKNYGDRVMSYTADCKYW